MNLKEKMRLDVGDEVNWVDPDNGVCSGTHRIVDILTESKRVEAIDSVLVLESDIGSVAEAYVSEVA